MKKQPEINWRKLLTIEAIILVDHFCDKIIEKSNFFDTVVKVKFALEQFGSDKQQIVTKREN